MLKVFSLITGVLFILLSLLGFAQDIIVYISDSYDIYEYTGWLNYIWRLAQIMLGVFLVMYFASKST